MRTFAITMLAFLMMMNLTIPLHAQDKDKPLDLTSGTWHIGLGSIFGTSNKGGKNIDIYPVFEDSKMVNALATARNFNTSIHLLEESTVKVDAKNKTIAGEMTILMTPDLWVPKDGQAFRIHVTINGKIEVKNDPKRGQVGTLSGSYTAKRVDGKPIYDEVKIVKESFYGGVGVNEPNWENAVFSAGLSQIVPKGHIDVDALIIRLGVDGDKVNWGTLGLAAQAKWPSHKAIPFDVSGFDKVASGKVKGKFQITGRHLHPGGDPDKKYTVELTALRVQGLIGMSATIAPVEKTDDPAWPRRAYGRGSGSRGGGGPRDFDKALWIHEIDNRPWFAEVKNFKAPEAGEHPRLLFRKDDIPALRKRANTAEGKAILKRLRDILGSDGEKLPTTFNTTPPHNHNKSPDFPLGTFTTWHAAGYGFLYQLTGEKKYADMSQQCAQWMLDGKIDIDNRYAWYKPGTDMRCGSVLAAMAYAYDFCYDAWPEDFRKKIALEIQNFNKVTASAEDGWKAKKAKDPNYDGQIERVTIAHLAGRTGYPPGSNHYGSLIGGPGVALLAIKGDPGVNTPWVEERLAEIESNIPRMLEHGFGDAGYYSEGFPPSRLSSNGGFMELLHAMRTAAGRDYVNVDRPHAAAITMRWVTHLGGTGFAQYPNRGTYGSDAMYGRGDMLSHTGDFAYGFGAVPAKYRPAVLWSWQQFVKQGEINNWQPAGESKYNAFKYPHRAIYAFIHWPIDQKAANPGEVLPNVIVDHIHGYFVARNHWKDKNDIIVTHLIEYGPKGYYAARDGSAEGRAGKLRIFGLGRKEVIEVGATGTPTHFAAGKDGSFSLTAGSALAIDMSKASGAELVVVTVGHKPKQSKKRGKGKGNDEPAPKLSMTIDDKKVPVQVYTMQTGDAPAVKIEGNAIKVGKQTFTWDGEKIVMATFKPAK